MFTDTRHSFHDVKTLIEEWTFASRENMLGAAKMFASHLSEDVDVYVDDETSVTVVWRGTDRRATIWIDGLLSTKRSAQALFSCVSVTPSGRKSVTHTLSTRGMDDLVRTLMQSGALKCQPVATRHSIASATTPGVSYTVPVSTSRVVGPCGCPARISACRHRKAVAALLGATLEEGGRDAAPSRDSWRERTVQQAIASGNILEVPYERRDIPKQHGGFWIKSLKKWGFKTRSAVDQARARLLQFA